MADDFGLRLASPFFGPARLTAEATEAYADVSLFVNAFFCALVYAFFARKLYAVSVASFDQCLGRMPE